MNPFRTLWHIVQLEHVDHVKVDDVKDLDALVGRRRAQVVAVVVGRECVDGAFCYN